ncbi:MAG: hypothetical protein MNPFHGCM_00426 [Gemmatimonadaceae bacterium]|nr:hypothetical protein [Gemmatimonadaceae bacterium]
MAVWRWFAAAAVAIAVGGWAFVDGMGSDQWRQVLPLLVGLAVWYLLWTRSLRAQHVAAQVWTLPLLAGAATALSVMLTHRAMSFWVLGLALIPLFFVVLPLGWGVVAAMALTAHAGWESRFGGTVTSLSSTELFAFLLSRAILATLIGVFLRSVVKLADRRERLAMELEATRGELARASHQTGVMEERQRMARELHDTLTQGMSAVVMHLETAEQLLPAGADESRVQLRRARAIARESLDETRRVVASLRPEQLDHAELPEAVARLCSVSAERMGIPVSTMVTGTPVPLHPEAEITLFRALQEGMSNVRKHAKASAVAVTLSYMDDLVMLDVRDDGIGLATMSPAGREPGGFGLQAMRERVRQLNGSVSVESERGEGTTLTVSIPLLHTADFPTVQLVTP